MDILYITREKNEEGKREVTLLKNSEEEVLKKLENKEVHISDIVNPSSFIQKAALVTQPSDIRFISNPDKSVLLDVINRYPYAIQYFEELEERVINKALRKNGMALEFVKNPTDKMEFLAVKQNPFALEFVKNPTPELIDIAIEMNQDAMRFAYNKEYKHIDYLTPSKLKQSIGRKPSSIILLHKAGIVEDYYGSEIVKPGRPTHEEEYGRSLWLFALSLDPLLLGYLSEDHQDEELCRKCAIYDERAICLIKNLELKEKLLREAFGITENITLK